MKKDINLMPPAQISRTRIILIVTLIFLFLVVFSIFMPIQQRNRLVAKSQRITEELLGNENLNNEYLDLQKYSTRLLKRIEILRKVNSVQGDITMLFDIVRETTSPYIELTSISISGNILDIKGTAPSDKIIADSVLKLQENEEIASVKIQEICLERSSLKRLFNLKCITSLNESNIEDLFVEGQDSGGQDLGGEDG